MDPSQRTSGALLGIFPFSSPSSKALEVPLHLLVLDQLRIVTDRAGADVAQLLRRFENIIAFAPVRQLNINL